MKPEDRTGWIYVLTHPATDAMGLVKIGMTSRDPAKRAAEITNAAGLIKPYTVAFCMHVPDRRAVENAIKANLGYCRVRGRKELFRCDVATAVAAIHTAGASGAIVIVQRRRTRSYRPHQLRRPYPRRRPAWLDVTIGLAVAVTVAVLLLQ